MDKHGSDRMNLVLTAPDHLMRATLIALFNDRVQFKTAAEYLQKIGHGVSHPGPPTTTGAKRKAQNDIKMCVQCQEPLSDEDNKDSNPCRHHNVNSCRMRIPRCGGIGMRTVWVSQKNKKTQKNIQTAFYGRDCDKDGTHPGCTRGQHKAVGVRRGRYPPTGHHTT
ncbi:hypothetical protein K461DRAFT_9926 [Myriangium duriaei CBS 260.36]|uniref:Uncharacterized protein n=1 Tax=Myriangium duriaei CBS 260.36 TaxID=1168546 RepID=A0A9P4J807_9PEZI|nr:hypothetical protein K461DRAFT_9926 [Myriangium duriaei CBS 260.36]